jgi:uncharacterized protein
VTAPSLKEQVRAQMTDAMRSGDKLTVGALRMLIASITNKEKEVLHDLSDEEVREVAGKEVKKRTESIEAFESAGRTELVDKEKAEREVLAVYAPEQLSNEQVDAIVEEAIAQTGATSRNEMGKVMGVVMGRAKGQVDGSVVQRKVLEKLGE